VDADGTEIRAIVYAPVPQRARWIEAELDRDGAVLQLSQSIRNIVSILVDDPAPYPSLLVVDFDSVTPVELMELHLVRERGWFGSIVGLGSVAPALRTSLAIDHVLTPPFVTDSLRDAIAFLRAETRLIPVVR